MSMSVNIHLETITVHVGLSALGDAVLYGTLDDGRCLAGTYLKQRLFAWHEASYYGTELAVEKTGELELIVLPAEQVIPFFASCRLLPVVRWAWDGEAAELRELAPVLEACVAQRGYVPSFEAYRQDGLLQWEWDEAALEEAAARDALAGFGGGKPELRKGLRAAFSAAVFARHYATEAALADLRMEFPRLFARDGAAASAAGMDAASWLIAVGWKADTAPFRPLLQLLEPNGPGEGGDEPEWRLRLVLQDKGNEARLVPVALDGRGEARGSWPAAWAAAVGERSAGWLERLRACLPADTFRALTAGPAGKGAAAGAALGDEAAWRFLTADSETLLAAGWQVLLPAWWESVRRRKPRLRAKVDAAAGNGGSTGRSLFGLDAIVDFDWRIAIGDAELTEAEFAELAARNRRLVRFRGRWIALDPALLAQIRRAMAGMDRSQGLTFQDVLQLHLLGGEDGEEAGTDGGGGDDAGRVRIEVELNGHLTRLIGQLGRQSEWPELPVPPGLQAELRGYQREGFAWLAFLRRFGLGCVLADDMGLGKTVQVIAYLLHTRREAADDAAAPAAPALVVCPTSVLGNWQKELTRFAPSLRVGLHYGSGRPNGEAFPEAYAGTDVVLTSYATAALDQDALQSFAWDAVILDEAQNIKNAQTKQSAAVRGLPARHRIALTGTPIENRLSELWSIYDFISPGYLGNARAFQLRFAAPIEKEGDAKRTAELQKLVRPFMLRRKKKDPAIRLDLPDKNEMKTYVHLTAEQAALYEHTVNDLMERMKKLEGIERKGAILAALTHLKRLCDHPLLHTGEPLPDPAAVRGGRIDTGPLIARSAKLERLLDMVRELREEGDRCLIFTQYIGMGQLLQLVLQQELQEPVLYLSGSTSKAARDRMIEQFQSQSLPADGQPSVFILSLKAGGVGLNLTAANHVFHFDRWWNPAVENQATDRAYRMGQTRDVQVHKFISLGTLEERIDEMLESKQKLSDNVIATSESWITELSTDALKELFTLRRQWAQ